MNEALDAIFLRERPRLRRLAVRILRDAELAEDVLQDSWLKLSRSRDEMIANAGGLFTTVVTRACIDVLRRRRGARDTEGGGPAHTPSGNDAPGDNEDDGPEQAALLADMIGTAMLVVLDRLAPLERVAFILHDIMAVPFAEIGGLIDRSPEASRQLASRARRRVRGGDYATNVGIASRRALAERFISAARAGDTAVLLDLLDPDATLDMDATAAKMASAGAVRGSEAVARFFSGRASGAHVARINGEVGLIVVFGERLGLIVSLRFSGSRIKSMTAIANHDGLKSADVALVLPAATYSAQPSRDGLR